MAKDLKDELSKEEKLRIRQRMNGIKDEVEQSDNKTVTKIAYYKDVDIAGIKVNLYVAEVEDEKGNKTKEVYNNREKIGICSKDGKEIIFDDKYMDSIGLALEKFDNDIDGKSLDEYNNLNLKDIEKCKEDEIEIERDRDSKKDKDNESKKQNELDEKDDKDKDKDENAIKDLLGSSPENIIDLEGHEDILRVLPSMRDYTKCYAVYKSTEEGFVGIGITKDANGKEIAEEFGMSVPIKGSWDDKDSPGNFITENGREGILITDDKDGIKVTLLEKDIKGNDVLTDIDFDGGHNDFERTKDNEKEIERLEKEKKEIEKEIEEIKNKIKDRESEETTEDIEDMEEELTKIEKTLEDESDTGRVRF